MTNVLISILFLIMGFKVQKPVKKISRGRSLEYRVVAKTMAKAGRKNHKRRVIKRRR